MAPLAQTLSVTLCCWRNSVQTHQPGVLGAHLSARSSCSLGPSVPGPQPTFCIARHSCTSVPISFADFALLAYNLLSNYVHAPSSFSNC